MNALRHLLGRFLPAIALVAAFVPAPGIAQVGQVDPDAIALLRRSTDYLTTLKQFRVTTSTSIESVLSTGQKLEFEHNVVLAVQRPNKLRADRVGELVAQSFFYDGKSLTMSLPAEKYHATVEAPSTIDGMLDFARDKLGVIAPASDFVYSNAYERLAEGLTSGYIVGTAIVGGARCTHIAFRNAEVDWQIWIRDGDKPLPCKVVITSKKMPQSPEFAVVMSKWETAPKLNEAMFRFTPAKGSRPIGFTSASGL